MSKEELIEQADLIRSLAASTDTEMPEGHEVQWRIGLCKKLYTLLPTLDRRQLTRIYEAMARVQFPRAEEANFRFAVQEELGRRFKLGELRHVTIAGPIAVDAPRPPLRLAKR